MDKLQLYLFLFNLGILAFYFFISKFINQYIQKWNRWLMPFVLLITVIIMIIVFYYYIEPEFESYTEPIQAILDVLPITNDEIMKAFVVYSFLMVIVFVFTKLIYLLAIKFIPIPEPFYGRKVADEFECYPKYAIFNIVFKIQFWLFLIVTLLYSIFRFDIVLAALNILTLYCFDVMTLFPEKVTSFNPQKFVSLDEDNSVEEEFKNYAEFEKFLEYVQDNYDESKKLNSIGKIRELNEER